MALPNLPSVPLPRLLLDAIRIVLVVVVYISLEFDFGAYDGDVEKWVTLAVLVGGAFTLRQASTPIEDPHAADGRALFPEEPDVPAFPGDPV